VGAQSGMSDETPKAPVPQAFLARGMVPDEELPRLWQRSLAPYFDAQPVAAADGPPPLLPDIHQYLLGKILLADSRFAAQTYTRDRRWMRRYDDSDHLLLQLFVRGENVVSNGTHDYVERPGNIFAVNLAHEVKARSTDARVMTLALSRELMREELPHLMDARGAVFAPESAAAQIFSDHLVSLRESLRHATADETPALTRATLGLLEALTLRDDIESGVAEHAAFHSACLYIDRHLANPFLDIDGICRHLRCSRATLYRIFRTHGGVHEHIQRRRLVACFKAIISSKHRHRRIFDVALDFGFSSPSHFSHLFREHFGMTPREVRDAGLDAAARAAPLASSSGSGEEAVEQMRLWAKTLAEFARP